MSTKNRYDTVVLGIGPDPAPTHRLDVYGLKDDREEAVEAFLPALRIRPLIVHHKRPTRRVVFTPIVTVPAMDPRQFRWQHLAVIGAFMFVIGVVVYKVGWGMK